MFSISDFRKALGEESLGAPARVKQGEQVNTPATAGLTSATSCRPDTPSKNNIDAPTRAASAILSPLLGSL